MGDFRKTPDDPKAPLLLRGGVRYCVPHPLSPAGAGGPGNFTCPLPSGKSPAGDAYKFVPGAYTPKEHGPGSHWWEDAWGYVERGWKATRAAVDEFERREGYVYMAFTLAMTPGYMMQAMSDETGLNVKGLPGAVLEGLSSVAGTLLKFTLAGAAAGLLATIEFGGEGVIPGAAAGFDAGIIYLEVTGLADITAYLLASLGEVMSRLRRGIERAWNAGRHGAPAFDDIKAAGHIMAGAFSVLFRALLEALLLYLVAKGVGKTVEMIGDSQLGKGFAEWFEKNQGELKSNPKLKPKSKTKGGAAEEAAGGGESSAARGGKGSNATKQSEPASKGTGPAPKSGTKPSGQGELTGKPTKIPPGEKNPNNIRALTRENESAATLSKAGYKVEQNPPTLPNGRNPDYRIEGQHFDCYSPGTSNPRNIASTLEEKVGKGQADRIVLNLDDSGVPLDGLKSQLTQHPIEGLKEVIVVKNNSVIPFYP